MSKRIVDSLDQEIEALEKAFERTPDSQEESTPAEESTESLSPRDSLTPTETVEAVQEVAQEPVTKTPTPETTSPVKTTRTNWKKKYETLDYRYKQLRAASDTFKYESRSTIADLHKRLAELEGKYDKLQEDHQDTLSKNTDDFEGILSKEEQEFLGPEALKAMTALSEKKLKPIREQIQKDREKAREQKIQEAGQTAKESHERFVKKIATVVPNYLDIDTDEEFLSWMDEVDPTSGYVRKRLFLKAAENRDVERVASFYKTFDNLKNPHQAELESKITPIGTGNTTTPTETSSDGPEITLAFIDKFTDNLQKGKYKDRPQYVAEVYDKIDEAYMRGTLRE